MCFCHFETGLLDGLVKNLAYILFYTKKRHCEHLNRVSQKVSKNFLGKGRTFAKVNYLHLCKK